MLGHDPTLEVDGALGAANDLVDRPGPGAGREVLPAPVGHHRDDHATVGHAALTDELGGAGHDRARCDASEDADLGETARPLDRLARAHDHPAVEKVLAVVV